MKGLLILQMLTKNNQVGFSLLELLIVVALLGIVALFTVPNINNWSKVREAEKDLSEIIKLIDYAVTSSKTYGKTVVIRNTISNNKTILNVSQLSSNDPAGCIGSYNTDPVYTNSIILKSQIKSKHNHQAITRNSSFNNSNGWLCFKQDGTSSGGGFEIINQNNKFRLNVWETSFYESTKFYNNQWIEYN